MAQSEADNAVDIAALGAKLDAINEKVIAIREQTTLTNGRVTALESWKNRAVGAWFGVSVFGPIVTGLIIGLVLSK